MTTKQHSQHRSFKRSIALWAAVACLAVNGVFAAANPFAKMAPEDRPAEHGLAWWRAQAYLKEKPAPDVVVLGSSLIMSPLQKYDAVYLKEKLDYVSHQHCSYMEDKLSCALGEKGTTCFNFGLPGEMISDQYMIAKALFTRREHKPKLLIIAIAVRDFMDNFVDSPASTESFSFFRAFAPIDDIVALVMPTVWNRSDYWFANSCAIFGFRREIQQSSINLMKTVLAPVVSPKTQFFHTISEPSVLHSTVSVGECIAKPSGSERYYDNRLEYKSHYRTTHDSLFKIEQAFLDRLLNLAADQKIGVMLVNMPVTMTNVALMPDGSYFKYLTLLKKEAKERQLAFVDLNDFKTFDQKTDYLDTVHLNSRGGRKLLDIFVNAIKADNKLVATLTDSRPKQRVAASKADSVF